MSSTFAPRDELHQTFIWSIIHTVLAEEQFHFSDNYSMVASQNAQSKRVSHGTWLQVLC